VEIVFEKAGESMITQTGGMAWMSEGIDMNTSANSGVIKGISRMISGESIFVAQYTAEREGASIAFASNMPGEIVPINLGKTKGIIAQKGAFLCSEPTVDINISFVKKFSSGIFGGEGFVLQDIAGEGMVFLETYGNMIEKNLASDEVLKVDVGNVVAFEKTVSYEVETIKGMKNILLGGEGLFLTKLTGPGRVILQTHNITEFAGYLARYIPNR
jgi:uncharacterized protein (TIGR00266 family)